ncbi:hypothetical protein FDP41_008403 [Naegleria fowleri]|uniref:Uncharacterized protein n=1 Tax=Naegleria fowleri TaxID=5763 RepID=A0A6A5BF09_NAEFO|nr:uncharacterized protein FDP41_008403 [Naegleria fowleri]KAF0973196.1 hypothetical protein FDP41_008403 [Naegleria fowleri]CAG4717894.1 unnamed protein product [Naegleria fowleri]
MSSSNISIIQRSLHHCNSSPCLTTKGATTSRILSSYASPNPPQQLPSSPYHHLSNKQIIIPKPVKVLNVSTPKHSLSTRSSSGDHQDNSSPSTSCHPKTASPSKPASPRGGLDSHSPQFSTGTPERLANEELIKILSRNSSSAASTANPAQVQINEEGKVNPSSSSMTPKHQTSRPSASPFSPHTLLHDTPSRTYSPPTIELEINESIFNENHLDDDDYDDVFPYSDENSNSIPSTFGYDDADFHTMRSSSHDHRKKRNFVTQEDISFLIELRTRPIEKYHLSYDDLDMAEPHHEGHKFAGAELGLLNFSPPTTCNSILNF